MAQSMAASDNKDLENTSVLINKRSWRIYQESSPSDQTSIRSYLYYLYLYLYLYEPASQAWPDQAHESISYTESNGRSTGTDRKVSSRATESRLGDYKRNVSVPLAEG